MKDDRYYLEIALEEAEIAFNEGTYPIGAVLVAPDGEILSRGRNRVYTQKDPTLHAEMDVIRQSGHALMNPIYKNKCTLYTSVEPCPMCTGAIILADITRVVWALTDDYLGALSKAKVGNDFRHKYDKVSISAMPLYDLALKSEKLHKTWDENCGVKYLGSNLAGNT